MCTDNLDVSSLPIPLPQNTGRVVDIALLERNKDTERTRFLRRRDDQDDDEIFFVEMARTHMIDALDFTLRSDSNIFLYALVVN
jgi:hypothetical protein